MYRLSICATMMLAGLLLLNGCLVGGHSDVRRTGTYVSPKTLDQIESGKTTAEWVRKVIGEPNERIGLPGGEEIWKYAYTETKDSSGYVFFVFGGSDSRVTTSNVFVQFKDGVVEKYWNG